MTREPGGRLAAALAATLLASLLVSSCGTKRDPEPVPTNTVAANPKPAPATTPAAEPSAQPVDIKSETGGLTFGYAWPAAAAAIPELDGWLRGNARSLRAKAQKNAADDKATAAKDGYPFHVHSYEEKFAIAADTPRVLVLQSDGYVFTGGAHGMPINTVIIWDKAAKKRVATSALIDIPRFKHLANDRFCKALDREREKRRGAPVKRADPSEVDGFNSCVDMTRQTLLPISKSGTALDTLRVVIGPYEAGAYAEGTYIIELPFDAKLLAAVKPDWKDAFTAR